MATCNHEDIAGIVGPAFIRGAVAKDKGSLDILCLGKHIHVRSEGSVIKKEI